MQLGIPLDIQQMQRGALIDIFCESPAGQTAGTFWLPAGIHIDGRDRIYVVDQINKRVQVFDYLDAG